MELKNLPSQTSVFFSIQPFPGDESLSNPWFYQTGVYPGYFDSIIGHGSSAIVLRGECQGRPAAFKFVEIGVKQKFVESTSDVLAILNKKLGEVAAMKSISGSAIIDFYGHFR